MKEFIEKLIERLEEETQYVDLSNSSSPVRCVVKAIHPQKVIEIINQLAEEYNQNSDQDLMIVESLPSLYPMMQPFEVEAIHRVVERTKDNNGWIPCSELPEENGMYLCTVFHADDYVVWIMRFNDGEFLKPDDVEDWNYELLAWMPIAPYQPKGE